MPDVLLATCAELPDGEPGGDLLTALAARGVDAAWAVWDDPGVDWTHARLVAVRSTWDYQERPQDFLAWSRRVEAAVPLLNGSAVFAWNLDKAYLVALADDVPTVPTRLVEPASAADDLADLVRAWGAVVVKPRTGAGGVGVVVLREGDGLRLADDGGPFLAQPLLASVATAGETSVFVLDGRAASQVVKHPRDGEIRVHEEYGGLTRAVPLDPDVARLAERAVTAAERRWDADLAYGRVDLLRADDGGWQVGELELIEPGLYLGVLPGNAEAFADLVVARAGPAPGVGTGPPRGR